MKPPLFIEGKERFAQPAKLQWFLKSKVANRVGIAVNDEAQRIRHSGSQTWAATYKKNVDHVLLATATPMLNIATVRPHTTVQTIHVTNL